MKLLKTAAPAALMLLALAACSSTGKKETKPAQAQKPAAQQQVQAENQIRTARVDSIDGSVEVAYVCGEKGDYPLNVMYGFKDGQVVAADVKIKDQTSGVLFRAIDFPDRNMFTNGQVTWVAEKADAANVGKVDGNMLMISGVQEVNGQKQRVDQIVTKYCKLKPAAAAKKPAAKKKK
ncbi:MAG: hypothetical protein Q4D82_02785 [Neisseria sp.]|nr:hypothetical protein [Neisseria sp.]